MLIANVTTGGRHGHSIEEALDSLKEVASDAIVLEFDSQQLVGHLVTCLAEVHQNNMCSPCSSAGLISCSDRIN